MASRLSSAACSLLLAAAPVLAQARWVQRFPAQSPPARVYHAMAYDAARDRVVLFGGAAFPQWFSDTWEWDGTTWSERFPVLRPPARSGAAMAYDANRGRIVLFGGLSATTGAPLGDTWEWDGTGWLLVSPSTAPLAPATVPLPRSGASLAYHAASQRVVLFGGGHVATSQFLSDTWEWNGQTWHRRVPLLSPAPRSEGALAPDGTNGNLLLFGGQIRYGALNDTWSWDGTNWRQLWPSVSPGARAASLAGYPQPGRTTLFGGIGGPVIGDTWLWNGVDWSPISAAPMPPARQGAPLASRAPRRSVLLFGGRGFQGAMFSDTWELDDGGCAPGGAGQPAGGLPCGCETEPRIGTSFCVSFSLPPPQGAGWGLLLVAPGPCLGNPLTLLPPGVCATALLRLLPATVVSGIGDPLRFCFALPASPALLGQQLCLQGAALEVGVCLRATDSVQVVVYR